FPPFPDYTIPNTAAVHTAYFLTNPGWVYWATKSRTWGDARNSTPEAGAAYTEAGVRSTLAVNDNVARPLAAIPTRVQAPPLAGRSLLFFCRRFSVSLIGVSPWPHGVLPPPLVRFFLCFRCRFVIRAWYFSMNAIGS